MVKQLSLQLGVPETVVALRSVNCSDKASGIIEINVGPAPLKAVPYAPAFFAASRISL